MNFPVYIADLAEVSASWKVKALLLLLFGPLGYNDLGHGVAAWDEDKAAIPSKIY